MRVLRAIVRSFVVNIFRINFKAAFVFRFDVRENLGPLPHCHLLARASAVFHE